MTVSSTNTKNSYSGDGSTTVFAYTFKIFDDDDITVILRTDATGGETVQTKTTDYTVSGVGNAGGGNITFGTAPASGITVVLIRETALTQSTDYTPNDPFPAASHEDALDRLTLMVQDQQEALDRSIKVSKTNTITSTEFTVGASTRANKIFAFDSSGDLAVTQEIGTYQGTDATTTTSAYAERDIVKSTTAAQLNNVYICIQTSPAGTLLTNTSYWQLLVDAVTAATSATNAAASATAAAASETAAAASESAAATSETNAATSASAASTSATNAATSATSASNSASAASTSETNAATSATNAASSATAAASSATAAAASETAAAASETAAATSETNAATSASSASTSATNAATSETNAATSASNAATSETNAATSASNASTSATSAASSATAAAASAASAASAYDSFDDRYLGVKASDPTLDNDGNALVSGALYFSSSENIMKVYDGASWIAATSAGNVSLILYEYTATSGQTTFSGADDNAATLSYTVNNIQVVMNGVILDPSDYTATTGTSVVLASGAALNDIVNIYAFKSFTVADTVSASAGGTFSANVAINGDLTVDTDTLYVDSANNKVGIGTTSSDGNLHVHSSSAGTVTAATDANQLVLESTANVGMSFLTGNTSTARIKFGDPDATNAGVISYAHSDDTMSFNTNGSQSMSIDSSGITVDRVVNSGVATTASTPTYTWGGQQALTGMYLPSANTIAFSTNATERVRIDSSGRLLIATTDISPAINNIEGTAIKDGRGEFSADGTTPLYVNKAQDGTLISLRSAGTGEGTISVTGTTVSYNGGHLARWSRLTDNSKDTSIVKGTVMTNLDEMVEWGDEDNEQLNKMAVSSVEGDANVAGVFVNWDEDDDWNDMNIAMTGDMVIRIAQGTTVARGDLLMSAGDGTAKPQGDDIVRSKTIAKVTSTHVSHTYDDGSYLVPCVLMAC